MADSRSPQRASWMHAFGRKFQLGQFYDYRTGQILTGINIDINTQLKSKCLSV